MAPGQPTGPDDVAGPVIGSPSRLSAVRGDIAVYGLSAALGQGIALVAVPLYARWLGPTEYGLVELLTVVSSLIITGCGDAVSSAAQKLWFDQSDRVERSPIVPTSVVVGTATSVVVSVLVVMVGVATGVDWRVALVVAVGSSILTVAARVSAEQFRVSRRPWPYLAAMLTRSLVGAVAALVVVEIVAPTATSVFAGFAAGSAISLAVTSVLGRSVPFRPIGDAQLVRRVVGVAAPLVPAVLAGWSMMLVDRFVVARYEPLSEVGIYGLANRMSSALLLVVYAFGSAWTPFALGRLADAAVDEARDRARALRYLSSSVAFAGLLLAVVAPPAVELVVGAAYADAADLVPPLAFAFVLLGSVSVTQVPLLAAGRVREMAVASTVAAATNVVAALVLVPRYGITGAAVATVVGFGAQAALYLARCQLASPAVGMVSSAMRCWLAAGVALGAVAWLQASGHAVWAVVVPTVFPLLLIGLRVLRPRDLKVLVAPWSVGRGTASV
jgi:O-antigen/teichoic acid export membrane protein